MQTRLFSRFSQACNSSDRTLRLQLYLTFSFLVAGSLRTNIPSPAPYLEQALVVDKDQGRLYLISKEQGKENDRSFRELINSFGLEIQLE